MATPPIFQFRAGFTRLLLMSSMSALYLLSGVPYRIYLYYTALQIQTLYIILYLRIGTSLVLLIGVYHLLIIMAMASRVLVSINRRHWSGMLYWEIPRQFFHDSCHTSVQKKAQQQLSSIKVCSYM